MGAILSLLGLAGSTKKTNILMVGLDAAGKTTILYKLKLDQKDAEVVTTPTVGFNLEVIKYRSLTLMIRDVGGQDKLRRLWRNYYEGTDAVVFVVDSNDGDRIPLAKEELHKLMNDDFLKNAVLLIYANKQDQPNAVSPATLATQLDTPSIQSKGFNVFIQPTVALTCEGIFEGLDWLANTLKKQAR